MSKKNFNWSWVWAILIVIVVALSGFFIVTHQFNKSKIIVSEEKVTNYIILSDSDAGTATPITLPTDLVIQISNPAFTASSTTISDATQLLSNQKIEGYNSLTLVSGSIGKAGSIAIINEAGTRLEYTFTLAPTSTPVITP